MDVKQITERLNRGVVYEGMAQDLENLLTSGDITQAEYDALSKKIGEITSSFKEVVIEEAKGESNEIEVSELTSEEPEGKVLEDLFATNPTATGASEDKDAAGSDSADESKEENEDPTPEPQETTSENKNESDTQEEPANNSVAQWVSDYHDYLYEWSARNPERRIKDFESKDNSIKATFKDGVALNFSSPSNVAVKAADPSSPKASDFDALLEVAKKSNQDIKLSDKMSAGFRKALIEACAKAEVRITNLSAEDADLYMSFVPAREETTLHDDERAAPQPESPVVENSDEAPVAETSSAAIPMPESFKNSDAAPEDKDPLDDIDFDLLREEVSGSSPDVDDVLAQMDANHAREEAESSKGSWWKRKKQKISTAMVAGATLATLLPGCTNLNKNKQQDAEQDPIEQAANLTEADSSAYQLSAEDFAQAAQAPEEIPVPTEWSEDMKIGKDRFYVTMNSFENWEVAYRNAYRLQDVLQMDALVMLSSLRNDAAWTCSPDSQGYADYNSGILAQYGLGDLGAAIKCGDTLNLEKIENYKILLRAGDNERLSVNTNILSELNPRFVYLTHDSEGYVIGDVNNCSRLEIIYHCGNVKDMRFSLRNCGCTNITERVDQVLQQDVTQPQAPVVDTITAPVAVVDTVQTAEPEPEVKRAQAPQGPRYVTVATTSNLGDAPLNGFTSTVSNGANESYVARGTKGAAKRMARELNNAGVAYADGFRNETDHPNSSKLEAQEKAKKQNYEWTVSTQTTRDDR